ncbi:MAG TPA: helix-hairpin-helix domain-containing protein [Pyrinomonadaceae bacterium]|jgi:DNA polymerase (family 10)
MDNYAIAERFNRLADLMEIRGDDRYRIRSYRNAAEAIETWPTELSRIAAEDGLKGLQALPGVGKAISGKIMELLTNGSFEAWEKLVAETPATVLDLLRVGGIGLKTAATLYQQFKISSLEDLRKFVAGGGLEMVDGVGEKSAERITESLKRLSEKPRAI